MLCAGRALCHLCTCCQTHVLRKIIGLYVSRALGNPLLPTAMS